MWYAECLKNCYNAVDRTFYDAINYSSRQQMPPSGFVILLKKQEKRSM